MLPTRSVWVTSLGAFLFLSVVVTWSCSSHPLHLASGRDASAGPDANGVLDATTRSDLLDPIYPARDGGMDWLLLSDTAEPYFRGDVRGPSDAGNSGSIDGPGYPLAQPGNALTDILPFIVNSGGCIQCLAVACPSAITCANDPICATEISCLVAPCHDPPPEMQTSPQDCVSNLAWNCGGLTDMTNCITTCKFVSPAAAVTGLQAGLCVYQLCGGSCANYSP
jgi:hypothetical protein